MSHETITKLCDVIKGKSFYLYIHWYDSTYLYVYCILIMVYMNFALTIQLGDFGNGIVYSIGNKGFYKSPFVN